MGGEWGDQEPRHAGPGLREPQGDPTSSRSLLGTRIGHAGGAVATEALGWALTCPCPFFSGRWENRGLGGSQGCQSAGQGSWPSTHSVRPPPVSPAPSSHPRPQAYTHQPRASSAQVRARSLRSWWARATQEGPPTPSCSGPTVGAGLARSEGQGPPSGPPRAAFPGLTNS